MATAKTYAAMLALVLLGICAISVIPRLLNDSFGLAGSLPYAAVMLFGGVWLLTAWVRDTHRRNEVLRREREE